MSTKQLGDYIIRVDSIDKTFANGVVALKDFSTDIRRSEVVVLIGPSGSGKSTFLRCLNGLEEIDSGSITIDGIPLDENKKNRLEIRKEVGMVFQHFGLMPHLSVFDNIAFPIRRHSAKPEKEIAERVQVEEALGESEERFRGIVEHAPFGYYRVGEHGLWQYVNPQWERMHGYARDEVVGRSFEITQPEEAKEQAEQHHRAQQELVVLAAAVTAVSTLTAQPELSTQVAVVAVLLLLILSLPIQAQEEQALILLVADPDAAGRHVDILHAGTHLGRGLAQ